MSASGEEYTKIELEESPKVGIPTSLEEHKEIDPEKLANISDTIDSDSLIPQHVLK